MSGAAPKLLRAHVTQDGAGEDVVRVVEARVQHRGAIVILVNMHEAWASRKQFGVGELARWFDSTPETALAKLEQRVLADLQSARRKVERLEQQHRLVLAAIFDQAPPRKPVCDTCNDTHKMPMEDREDVSCTRCPTPCEQCVVRGSQGGAGAYCARTPCPCACHKKATP